MRPQCCWSILSRKSKKKQQGLLMRTRGVCMSHASMHNGVTKVCCCRCCCLAHAGETAVVLPVVFRCLLVSADHHSSSHGSSAGLVASLRQGCCLPVLPAQHLQQQEHCRSLRTCRCLCQQEQSQLQEELHPDSNLHALSTVAM